MWKLEQHKLTPKYEIPYSLVHLVNHYFLTMEEDDNQFKITCQRFNSFVICSGRSVEVLYITFLCDGMSTLGLYPEKLFKENFYFLWHARTKCNVCIRSF